MRCARSAPSGAHAASAPPPPSPGASRKLARSARAPLAQPACSACPRAACSGARAARGRCADRWRRAARAHARSPQRCSRRAPLCMRGALSGDTVAPRVRHAARPPARHACNGRSKTRVACGRRGGRPASRRCRRRSGGPRGAPAEPRLEPRTRALRVRSEQRLQRRPNLQ